MRVEVVRTTGVHLVVGRSLRSDAPSSLLRLLLRPFLQGEDGPVNVRPGKRSGRAKELVVEARPSTKCVIGESKREMGKNESRELPVYIPTPHRYRRSIYSTCLHVVMFGWLSAITTGVSISARLLWA